MKPRIHPRLRHITTSTTRVPLRISPLPVLSPTTVPFFRDTYFNPALPCLFPPSHFTSTLPAISQWFTPHPKFPHLQTANLMFFQKTLNERLDVLLLMEVSLPSSGKFLLIHSPLRKLLEDMSVAGPRDANVTTYLAQCSVQELPELKYTLPPPKYTRAGSGDIYDINLWMGHAARIVTPLHKDPNPNLFVQIAGIKRVRLFDPRTGREIMQQFGGGVRRLRTPDEMMDGKHVEVLEGVVWAEDEAKDGVPGFEALMGPGDGLFIPRGWWHAVQSVGDVGAVASVNWWFR